MKTKNFALLIAVPTLMAISTFSLAHSDSHKEDDFKKHGSSEYRGKHGARNPERMLKKMTKALDLTEQQQTELKAAFESQKSVMDANKESRKSLHDAIRKLDVNAADYSAQLATVKAQAGLAAQTKIDNLMSMKQQLAKILTSEQLEKLEEMKMKKGQEKGKRKGKHNQDEASTESNS